MDSIFPEPRAEVYCFRLNFNISKLGYYVLFEKWPSTISCYYKSMKYFCLERSSEVCEELSSLHQHDTVTFDQNITRYCSNASWPFAKCHYLTQRRGLTKKPTPLNLQGKVSPSILNCAEMNFGIRTCFAVFQITKLFLTNWRQFS